MDDMIDEYITLNIISIKELSTGRYSYQSTSIQIMNGYECNGTDIFMR